MHLHGTDFTVVAKDGHPLAAPYKADVIQVGSGERYDIAFTLRHAPASGSSTATSATT